MIAKNSRSRSPRAFNTTIRALTVISLNALVATTSMLAAEFLNKEYPNQSKVVVMNKSKVPVFTFDSETQEFALKQVRPNNELIGSKARNLSFLNGLGYVQIPKWLSIGTTVFREVVHSNPILRKNLDVLCSAMEQYAEASGKDNFEEGIFKKAGMVRKLVEEITLPDSLVNTIETVFNNISEHGTKPIAVRSSAKSEDLPGASFAGLYDSYLNIIDFKAFLDALKMCWASSFNDRAVQYYMQKEVSLKDSFMGVVAMQLVKARVSGTVFTTDVTTGYNGIHIMANNGLEGVVGGDISADSYLINPTNGTILKRVKGSKEFCYQPNEDGSGVKKIAMTGLNKDYCISPTEAKELAALIQRVGEDYQQVSKGPVDTEFVINEKGGIEIVQIRPVVTSNVTQVDDVDFEAIKGKSLNSLAVGKHAVFGVKHGKIKVIEDFHDLESGMIHIHPDDIVVTTRTENQWTQYLTKFSGIITTEGNPTSHPVLISREHGVPCLVGVSDAVGKFKHLNGEWVTLDGFRKSVYLGKQALKSVSLDKIAEAYRVVEEEKVQDEEIMIKDCFLKNFMMRDGDGHWLVGLTSSFSGALLDIIVKSYAKRQDVINNSGVFPKVTFETKQKIVSASNGQGSVFDHWWVPHVEQIKLCDGMNLENFKNFYQNKADRMRELYELCKGFQLNINSWNKFKEIYEELTAYQLLGFLERYPAIRKTYRLAKSHSVPVLFFEEFASQVQEQAFEEDFEFLNRTKEMGQKLLALMDKETALSITLKKLKDKKEFYHDLEEFSREFKFIKSEDWIEEVPLEKALEKVVAQIKSGDLELKQKKVLQDAEEEYFVDFPELRDWITLSIVKKLQQNNLHHVRPRAQWFVRNELLKFGEELTSKGILSFPKDILKLPLNTLETLIKNYH